MKKNNLIPFGFSAMFLALAGCGGESAKIIETPNRGVTTTVNGCTPTDSRCQGFVIDYPVDGLNFNCSSDTTKHYVTRLEGNVSSGGCLVGDQINFYIQGAESDRKVDLGSVNLKTLIPVPIANKPEFINLIDIATGMTNKPAENTTSTDDTYKTMIGLIKLFQSIGIQQEGYVVGDIQPIYLTTSFKNNLKNISANVDYKDFLDGSYLTDLAPWWNANNVSDTEADLVAKKLLNLSNTAVYIAEYLPLDELFNLNILGFQGESQANASINNMYSLTTRQGYTIGYSLQWNGNVKNQQGNVDLSKKLGLIYSVAPTKLNTYSQTGANNTYLYDIKDWLNPITHKISTPLTLKTDAAPISEMLEIYQGTFVKDVLPGTEALYKRVKATETAAPASEYGKWRQTKSGESFTGTVDIYKTNPATYLNREVFLTRNNTKPGDTYLFPLYADLQFSFKDTSIVPITISVVIDEHGDIRTNRSATSLTSNQCLEVNNTLVDTNNVQQYRIGTTGAVNSSVNDKSITLRMILANPIFGQLDGALIGLNYLSRTYAGEKVNFAFNSDGVRLNLQNLITDKNTSRGINITGWVGNIPKTAEWTNIFAGYHTVFKMNADNPAVTNPDYEKLQTGTLSVSLPSCYSVKTQPNTP